MNDLPFIRAVNSEYPGSANLELIQKRKTLVEVA
jgi:hypothetical protein